MAAKQFTPDEWEKIREELEKNPGKYGFPERVYGSTVIGSFNIRKLGAARNRNAETWDFLAHICKQFDLLAVQEIMDDLSGFQKLMEMLGPEFGMIVSDKTGVFPGDTGLGERLGFIFRWSVVKRAEVVSDITYDRSKVLELLRKNIDDINLALATYNEKMEDYEAGRRKTKPVIHMPAFLSFIRQPYCVSFQIVGHPGTTPYQFMAVNAHLHFGAYMSDRKQELNALLEWIIARVKEVGKAYYPNFILLGDLNLDFDDPETDREGIEDYLKMFDNNAGEQVNVNFPFLDPHPQDGLQRTNARLTETFDQIGLFFREKGLPTYLDNEHMGDHPQGPDFRVFNFANLFSKALLGKEYGNLTKAEKDALVKRFEHKVSDHMPLWLRLPLPGK